MKLSIFINVLSTHQEGLCNSFYKILGDEFKAVIFGKLPQFRVEAGFHDMGKKYSYCIVLPEDEPQREQELVKIVQWTDVGIVGGVPSVIIDMLLENGKKCFLFSERFYKKGTWRRFIPTTLNKVKARYRNHPDFKVLCASAYLPYDLRISGYNGELLQWGYFPEIQQYPRQGLKHPVSILWVGRLIGWKHPETAVNIAAQLKKDKIEFNMTIVGYGKLKNKLKKLLQNKKLVDCVTFKDAVPPDEIHRMMSQSDIFLATSDYNEGWGAVINESMRQGCAVVASSAMGSVSFMIKDGVNGFVCQWNDFNKFYDCTKQLIIDDQLRAKISCNAIKTMENEYSSDIAADRFCRYCAGERFGDGICSPAKIRKK